MTKYRKVAFLFPGQGAQYPGMAQDFVQSFSSARLKFEEADDILERKLSSIILHGPEATLTETKNSQTAIFVTSLTLLQVVQELIPTLKPSICAGLSLGEYSALTAAGYLSFQEALPLVQYRGQFMNEACEKAKGTMAVILGLEAKQVEQLVKEVNLPHDLWIANFNCPGQVVISGTVKGIGAGTEAAKARGAKRVLPLQVHGAFHSGLMKFAEERLSPYIEEVSLAKSPVEIVMNVPGNFVNKFDEMKQNLIRQVTQSVRWEQGIRVMDEQEVDLFVEFGPGKTLSGMNKKIGVRAQTITIDKVEDLEILAKEWG